MCQWIALFILGSDGDLYNLTMSPLSNLVNCHKLCYIKCIQETVSMVILNSTHIAVSGIQMDNQSKIFSVLWYLPRGMQN